MTLRLPLVLAAVVLIAGCRQRESTTLERQEAANVISEAEFAVTMKEWPRAEGLYVHATELCPDQGQTWIGLGVVRMRQHNPDGAKSAYKSALSAYKEEFRRNPANTGLVASVASVMVILGRADDARAFVEKARANNPDDRFLRNFVEMKGVDKIIADPGVKEVSP
jgi:Flp pilus assembly protein TadD